MSCKGGALLKVGRLLDITSWSTWHARNFSRCAKGTARLISCFNYSHQDAGGGGGQALCITSNLQASGLLLRIRMVALKLVLRPCSIQEDMSSGSPIPLLHGWLQTEHGFSCLHVSVLCIDHCRPEHSMTEAAMTVRHVREWEHL